MGSFERNNACPGGYSINWDPGVVSSTSRPSTCTNEIALTSTICGRRIAEGEVCDSFSFSEVNPLRWLRIEAWMSESYSWSHMDLCYERSVSWSSSTFQDQGLTCLTPQIKMTLPGTRLQPRLRLLVQDWSPYHRTGHSQPFSAVLGLFASRIASVRVRIAVAALKVGDGHGHPKYRLYRQQGNFR